MSKAEAFLNWWINNNIIDVPSDANEIAAWAHRLTDRFTSAAAQLGIDLEDPGLDRERLYQRMVDAVRQTKQDAGLDRTDRIL